MLDITDDRKTRTKLIEMGLLTPSKIVYHPNERPTMSQHLLDRVIARYVELGLIPVPRPPEVAPKLQRFVVKTGEGVH